LKPSTDSVSQTQKHKDNSQDMFINVFFKELDCCWSGHAVLHKSHGYKMGLVSFGKKLGCSHESYIAIN